MKKNLLSIVLLCILLVGSAFAQSRTITGKVTSASNGSAVAGVSVLVQGASQSTQSGQNGNYSIIANTGGSLVFRAIGFEDHYHRRLKRYKCGLSRIFRSIR